MFGRLLYPVLVSLAIAMTIAAFAYVIYFITRRLRENGDAYFIRMRKRQDDLFKQLETSMKGLNKKVDERLVELKIELGGLDRKLSLIRQDLEVLRRAGSALAYAGYGMPSVPEVKAEPAFPAAAEEYLNRMRRSIIVVKPDFQNGILVKDLEGRGELALVEDNSAPDGLLYIIPKVSDFKTKQDFYSYYEKYYDCARPSSGEVWVIEPAVVDKVSGGWELREKGVLEVR